MLDYLSRSLVDPVDDDTHNKVHLNSVHPAILSNTPNNKHLPTSSIASPVTMYSHTRNLSLPCNNKPTHQTTSSRLQMTLDDLRIDYTGGITQLKAVQQNASGLQHIKNNLNSNRYVDCYLLQDGVLMHRSLNNKFVLCVPRRKIR